MSDKNSVNVKPIRSYSGQDGFKTAGDAAYPVSRPRAAELRANGLVEYDDAADEAVEIDTAAAAASDAVKINRQPKNKMAVPPANKTV